jgi:hypothetical protein
VVLGGYSPGEVEQLLMPNMTLDVDYTKESLKFDIERIIDLVSKKKIAFPFS